MGVEEGGRGSRVLGGKRIEEEWFPTVGDRGRLGD